MNGHAVSLPFFIEHIWIVSALPVLGAAITGLTLRKFDSEVIDGAVNGIVRAAQFISGMLRRFDDVFIDGSISTGARFVRLASVPVRMLQTGFLQTYMFLAVAGIVGFLGYYMYVLLRH